MDEADIKGSSLPLLTRSQIRQLQVAFPPRCLRPRETVEDHLRYAGQVRLIEALSSIEAAHRDRDADALTDRQARAEADNIDAMADILSGDAEYAGA